VKFNVLTEKLAALRDSYILRQPLNIIIQYEQKIDDLRKGLAIRIDHLVKMRQESFKFLTGKLESLSPLAILNRGYSITAKLPEGIIIKDASLLKKDDIVETKLGNGRFRSKVEEIG
jgi:exodeoxyribonuclease VII large subunit